MKVFMCWRGDWCGAVDPIGGEHRRLGADEHRPEARIGQWCHVLRECWLPHLSSCRISASATGQVRQLRLDGIWADSLPSRAAGGRNNPVHTQVLHHLAIVACAVSKDEHHHL